MDPIFFVSEAAPFNRDLLLEVVRLSPPTDCTVRFPFSVPVARVDAFFSLRVVYLQLAAHIVVSSLSASCCTTGIPVQHPTSANKRFYRVERRDVVSVGVGGRLGEDTFTLLLLKAHLAL